MVSGRILPEALLMRAKKQVLVIAGLCLEAPPPLPKFFSLRGEPGLTFSPFGRRRFSQKKKHGLYCACPGVVLDIRESQHQLPSD